MEYTYKVDGRHVTLQRELGMVGVRYREPAAASTRAAFAARAGVNFAHRMEIPNEKFTVLPKPGGDAVSVAEVAVAAQPGSVSRLSPVFRLGAVKVLATDRVLVGLEDSDEPVYPLLKNMKTVNVTSRGYGEYMVQLGEEVDPLLAATELAALQGVRYAEPDFINIGPHLARTSVPASVQEMMASKADGTPDEYLAKQYAMTITQARDAWSLQQGSPNIRIAILDEGVDTQHEDLRNVVVAAYDAADEDDFQEPNPWDGHGTACAGLAAAIPNNGKGVRGVAGGCSVMAVRIAYSDAPGQDWVTRNSWMAGAIDWSWRNNADVLSNSWGGGAPSSAIVSAFQRARALGRKGLGCVVVVASGNEASVVSFPASISGVLAVSASNEYDEFKTKTSKDGEGWGSNFGPEISICAPGVHNYTTDISGVGGYNNQGSYYAAFNGTSSATPIVAGAVALMLSANPALTEQQVREKLCSSADKIGKMKYIGGRNEQFGFGRLNVLAAVKAAKA